MEIIEIKIFKTKLKAPVVARANIVLNDAFIIRGITLLEKENHRFISMPSRKIKKGNKTSYRDICHPLNQEVRDALTTEIFEAYDEFIKSEAQE